MVAHAATVVAHTHVTAEEDTMALALVIAVGTGMPAYLIPA